MNEDKSLKPDFDFESWKDKHMKFAIDSAPRWVSGVKAKYGKSNTKYACVGSVHSHTRLEVLSILICLQLLLRSSVCDG